MSRDIRVSLIDYGAGNLHSLAKALEVPNVIVRVEPDPVCALDRHACDLLVLPGVGAFGAAAERLAGARDAIREAAASGLPIIGICLGMQLLFDSSEEGVGPGLGIIHGVVRRLRGARVPQIGWNTVERASRGCDAAIGAIELAYYANSYVCTPEDAACITAWSTHEGERFAASVVAGPNDNVVGVQYHPEKSSVAGVRFLRALVNRACTARQR